MTTALLVDDHPVFLDGLRALLETSGIDVVASTGMGAEVVRLLDLEPDVVVVDLGLPDMDGVEVTRRVVESRPDARVLVLTMFDEQGAIARAIAAGARGYLVKNARAAEIVSAVQAVANGTFVLGSTIADPARSAIAFRGSPVVVDARGISRADFPSLADRERQVLALIADGLDNRAIAERLGLSGKTVANYVSNILAKLQASDRLTAASMARAAQDGRARGRSLTDERPPGRRPISSPPGSWPGERGRLT